MGTQLDYFRERMIRATWVQDTRTERVGLVTYLDRRTSMATVVTESLHTPKGKLCRLEIARWPAVDLVVLNVVLRR